MEVALIPPIGLLDEAASGEFQLMLPLRKLLESTDYVDYYISQSTQGKRIILDNGAAEAEQCSFMRLIEYAYMYGVSELAIPDVLGDSSATVIKLYDFMRCCAPELNGKFDLGFVAQGRDRHEAFRTVATVMQGKWADRISVVYLPRLLSSDQDLYARISLARKIRDAYDGRLAIHLFGASWRWPQEVLSASTMVPEIRSIDTSLPFTAAIAGYDVTSLPSERMTRTEGYFESEVSGGSARYILVRKNIDVYRGWAGCTEAPASEL